MCGDFSADYGNKSDFPRDVLSGSDLSVLCRAIASVTNGEVNTPPHHLSVR